MTTTIITDRLVLKPINFSDAEFLFEIKSNRDVAKYLGGNVYHDKAEVIQWFAKYCDENGHSKTPYWIISLNSGEKIGTLCLWNFQLDERVAEWGYMLLPEFQGKGYMEEALRARLNYADKLTTIDKTEAYTHFENIQSSKLLEKLGFMLTDKKEDDLIVWERKKA